MLIIILLNLLAFENKKDTDYYPFHGNSPYDKIPTKKEPIRMLGFVSKFPHHIDKGVYPCRK